MSAAALTKTRPAPTTRARIITPELRVVEGQGSARSFRLLAAIVVTVIAVIVGINLYVSTQMTATAYQIRDKQIELTRLSEESQMLQQKLKSVSSPGNLERIARSEGMVPAGQAGFITLSTSSVEGGKPAQ